MKKLAVKIEFKEVNAVDPREVAEVAEAYARLIDMMFCMRLQYSNDDDVSFGWKVKL